MAASGSQINTRPNDSSTMATGSGTRRRVSQFRGGMRTVASMADNRKGTTTGAAIFRPPITMTKAAAPSNRLMGPGEARGDSGM